MAITIESQETREICVAEYMDYVETHVDPEDDASIIESAGMLKALYNNRSFLVDYYNNELSKTLERRLHTFLSPQSYVMATSKDGRFALRSNVWTVPSSHPDRADMESRLFSYNSAHDHNFNFLTVGYYGPGYETLLYEYETDSSGIAGYVGEKVSLRFLEKTSLPEGKLMFYRAAKDIHVQLPPPSLSISLNLLLNTESNHRRAQFYIDVEKQVVTGYPDINLASRRVALINFARYFHDERTLELVEDLALHSSCRRTKMAAVDSLAHVGNSEQVFERYCSHADPKIAAYARAQATGMSKLSHRPTP